ncbi:MAG: KH domain-containing protein [Akkermansiaceae bacterium]|nr:KH domain-containing protein [Akkermansia sp.]MCD7799565.1 KH domain-containing protein [Akkermansiaceae bacterium]MCD8070976.1 KH domain-containing protein [Akkermansiaceae bacterium]
MKLVVDILRRYLQLVAAQFVQRPELAELRIAEAPESLMVRFRLVLDQGDVARVIGRNGMTASAIRSLAKAVGEKHGVRVVIHILSHEEAAREA